MKRVYIVAASRFRMKTDLFKNVYWCRMANNFYTPCLDEAYDYSREIIR